MGIQFNKSGGGLSPTLHTHVLSRIIRCTASGGGERLERRSSKESKIQAVRWMDIFMDRREEETKGSFIAPLPRMQLDDVTRSIV